MKPDSVFDLIGKYGVVPVIAIDDVRSALPLADALLEGGLPVIEITFRTAAALGAIKAIADKRPELLVGAGTVLSVENLRAAIESGARFGVAPGLNPEVVAAAGEANLPFVPGVATPSDVECGLSMDCTVLKFFPAEASGGVAMLKALGGPYKHTGVKFVPTGGVNAGNLETYLSLETVAACGGTWIAKRDDLADGNWQQITERCKEVAKAVAEVRG